MVINSTMLVEGHCHCHCSQPMLPTERPPQHLAPASCHVPRIATCRLTDSLSFCSCLRTSSPSQQRCKLPSAPVPINHATRLCRNRRANDSNAHKTRQPILSPQALHGSLRRSPSLQERPRLRLGRVLRHWRGWPWRWRRGERRRKNQGPRKFRGWLLPSQAPLHCHWFVLRWPCWCSRAP